MELRDFVRDLSDRAFYELMMACMDRIADRTRPIQIRCADRLTETERFAMESNRKILAIKSVRERLGLGLKEAKDFVEREYSV